MTLPSTNLWSQSTRKIGHWFDTTKQENLLFLKVVKPQNPNQFNLRLATVQWYYLSAYGE